MFQVSQLKTVRFMVADAMMATFNTHFSGRTLICAGPGVCPACLVERPRAKSYIVAVMAKRLELVELCSSLRAAVDEALRKVSGSSLMGLVVAASRTACRRPWVLTEWGYRPELVSQAPASAMAELIADLYRLPPGPQFETVSDVVRRGGLCHADLLRGTVLPGLA